MYIIYTCITVSANIYAVDMHRKNGLKLLPQNENGNIIFFFYFISYDFS